jgi:ATP-dependent Zn protease
MNIFGYSNGQTKITPSNDLVLCKNTAALLFAGRESEELILGNYLSGWEEDKYQLQKLSKKFSPEKHQLFLAEGLHYAITIVKRLKHKIIEISDALLEKERLSVEEIEAIIKQTKNDT